MPQYPTRDIRGLLASGGDPGAQLNIGREGARQVSESVPDIGLQLMDLLRKYQRGFAEQRFGAQQTQARGILREAPQALIGAPPGLQAGVRAAEAEVFEPLISGAQESERTIAGHLGQIKDIVTLYQTQQQRARDDAQANIKFLIDKGGSSAIEALLQTEPETKALKSSGIDEKTLSLLLPGIKTKEEQEQLKAVEQQQSRDLLDLIRLQTLQQKGTIPTIPLGIIPPAQQKQILTQTIKRLPVGQQDAAFSAIGVFKNSGELLKLLDEGVKTGPLAGVRQRGGQILRGTNKKFNEFKAASTQLTANFIKAISGVQVSDKERRFLFGSLPTEFKQEQVNKDNVGVLLEFLKNRYETQLGISFDQFPNAIPLPQNQTTNQWEYIP